MSPESVTRLRIELHHIRVALAQIDRLLEDEQQDIRSAWARHPSHGSTAAPTFRSVD